MTAIYNKSGWPSGLRRQTQGCSLLPDREEISGPRMRAWVQIPLLTKTFFHSRWHVRVTRVKVLLCSSSSSSSWVYGHCSNYCIIVHFLLACSILHLGPRSLGRQNLLALKNGRYRRPAAGLQHCILLPITSRRSRLQFFASFYPQLTN
jgi:hypothetical protein